MVENGFISINIAVVTISDTRDLNNDKSGDTLVNRITQFGHKVTFREIVKDDFDKISNLFVNETADLSADEKYLVDREYKLYERLYRNPNNIKFIKDAMFGSTNEQYGTSYKSRYDDLKYQFAGKTWTSQVKRITEEERKLDLDQSQIEYKNRDHALFIAFAPYKNPRYSISVLVEHGGSGSSGAAPLASKLIKKIIDRHSLREQINSGSTNLA